MLTESDRGAAFRAEGGISWVCSFELPGVHASVPTARRYVRTVLGPGACDVELAVSELVTNALEHSESGNGGTIVLKLAGGEERLRAEVTDAGSAVSRPHVERAAPDDESGRGLEIVRAVSLDWGIEGTTVWCEFPTARSNREAQE
ncbi:MAG TPA: ATP-binding protein [Streptosporangiaceae bacterium]